MAATSEVVGAKMPTKFSAQADAGGEGGQAAAIAD